MQLIYFYIRQSQIQCNHFHLQACKNKDLNASNIDDILSDMLNIDDCDLYDMNDPRQITGTTNDRNNDDFYYDRDSDDDDDFESRRTCDHSFHDEDEIEEEEDEDDEDDTEASKRRHNLLRTQLIIEAASDDNANVHSFDNMKFTNFDLAPWNTNQPAAAPFVGAQSNHFGANAFFPDEINFPTNFPSSSVTAIFDPVDPFASSFSDSSVPNKSPSFSFDPSSAFGDFDAVFGSSSGNPSTVVHSADNVAFDTDFSTTIDSTPQVKPNPIAEPHKNEVETPQFEGSLESQGTSNGTVETSENAKL